VANLALAIKDMETWKEIVKHLFWLIRSSLQGKQGAVVWSGESDLQSARGYI
jgi:hypothetical protein